MEATEQKKIDLIPSAEAMESLGLKSSAFYKRLEFLEITPQKEGRKSYLTADEVARLELLGKHIEATGSMEGFDKSSSLTVINDTRLAEVEEPINQTKSTASKQFQGILRDAMQHRAGVEKAKYAIAAQLNVEDLDDDLIEEIEETRAATLPKSISASETAGAILNQFMSGKI